MIKIASLDKNILFIGHCHVQEYENYLYTIDHMKHMVKINILTGHGEIDNLQFVLKIIFNCKFIKKKKTTCIFSKLVQLIMKVPV